MTVTTKAAPGRGWSVRRIAAGTVVVAAAAVVVMPQHAVAVVRVSAVALALVALAAAVVDRLSPHERTEVGVSASHSPFDVAERAAGPRRDAPASLVRIRGELAGGQVHRGLPPLSPLVARRLAVVVDATLAGEGLQMDDPAQHDAIRARLSPQAWSAVTAPRTGASARERGAPRRFARADEIAATVHAVLDELERPPSRRTR